MSFDRSVDVRCDGCGRKAQRDSRTAREAWANAKMVGWRRVGSQHYCFFCWYTVEHRGEATS
jgi:hypothetical protein